MKKFTLLAMVAFTAIIFSSCDKLKDKLLPAFDTNMKDVQVTIPVVTSTTAETTTGSATVQFNLDSIVRANTNGNFNITNLKSVKVKSIQLGLTNSDDVSNIANFESAKIAFASSSNATPIVIGTGNIPDVMSASLNIPADASIELKDYLKDTNVTYTILTKARRATRHELNAVVSISLHVN